MLWLLTARAVPFNVHVNELGVPVNISTVSVIGEPSSQAGDDDTVASISSGMVITMLASSVQVRLSEGLTVTE